MDKAIRLFKRLWIICFTNNPYRIKSFADLYLPSMGEPVDCNETLTTVLLADAGQPINYNLPLITYQQTAGQKGKGNQARFLSVGIFKEPDRYLYSVTNGTVWSAIGLVYDSQLRCFINESAKEWVTNLNHSALTNVVHFPHKTYLEGVTLSCLTNGADGGFYHFLFEAMVKLHFVQPIINHVNQILLNGPANPWKLKWLQRANIDISKIIWADNTAHYQCKQLLFTSRLVSDQQINPWSITALKTLFDIQPAIKPITNKAIWITRKGSSARDIFWENELLKHFPSIEYIDLVDLDAAETIKKMQLATHIIAPHGAGLSNIYLCNNGTHVLELYPLDALYKPCFHRLSAVCSLKHHVAWINFNNQNDGEQGLSFLKSLITEFVCQN